MLVAACAVSLVFALVFSLYRLPVAAVGYALLLCLVPAAPLAAWDFVRFRRRHARLAALLSGGMVSPDDLPEPASQAEADDQVLIRALFADRTRLEEAAARGYREIVDYYTLWAHQIKTPIAAMRLILQSEDTPNPPELSEQLRRIEQYVEMVLCYLRLGSDATDYVIRSCDLDGIVRACARRYASQFIRKKLRFRCDCADVRVLTDEKWLSFAVDQLLSNAVKYTPSGEIAAYVEAPATFVIRDTGIGIAPEDLPRVFEKGYTGLNGRADMRATGIGLYLVKRVLDRLGHAISLESVPGEGTTVRVNLDARRLDFE